MISCTNDSDDKGPSADLKKKALTTYADIVYASYVDARDAGVKLQTAIDAFVAAPSQATQDAAKAAWKAARTPYGQTEAYRFYNGPIDDKEDGPEGLMNSWPLDEAHIDYVDGKEGAGIINMTKDFPTITKATLIKANGNPGETDIATGYHAIEFLLWGQDRDDPSAKTAGKRPFTDYVTGEAGTAAHQDRRGAYLKLAAELLVENLNHVVDAWKPDAANYRADFLAANPDVSLAKILVGMGSLSGAELAGERMTVALANGNQEDEHSCFSDNTHNDVILNDQGINNVYNGNYEKTDGSWVKGTSLYEVVKAADPATADKLKGELDASLAKAKAIEPPFDLAISLGNTAGRAEVQATVDALRAQTTTIEGAAKALRLTLALE
ncbi:MAG TPA: imelysin family protein [Fibrobacteria bacterium]|nr:imelysin family protein [Fibrobacteria bacterium]